VLPLLIFSCIQKKSTGLTDLEVAELKLEMDRQFAAMIDGDIGKIERIYSDNFKLARRKGVLLKKKEWLEMLKSGRRGYGAHRHNRIHT
jgi:hypothetical protein